MPKGPTLIKNKVLFSLFHSNWKTIRPPSPITYYNRGPTSVSLSSGDRETAKSDDKHTKATIWAKEEATEI